MSEPGFRESGLQNCVFVLNDFCFRQVPENKMSVDCGYLDPSLWPQLPKAVPSTAPALQWMQESADPASAQTSVWTWTGAWKTLESAFHGVADNSSLQGTSSCTKCGWWLALPLKLDMLDVWVGKETCCWGWRAGGGVVGLERWAEHREIALENQWPEDFERVFCRLLKILNQH